MAQSDLVMDVLRESEDFLAKKFKEANDLIKERLEACFANYQKYRETGDHSYLKNDNETGENNQSAVVPGRPKRTNKKTALADITGNNMLSLEIKKEKLSTIASLGSPPIDPSNIDINIKTEDGEWMPAPRMLPPRKRKIQSEQTDTVKRSTRTKKKPQKLLEVDEEKKSKSSSENEGNQSAQTDYEDAVSNLDNNENQHKPNATYVASSKTPETINSTIVVEKPQIVKSSEDMQVDSGASKIVSKEATPPKPITQKKGTKEIFSPFEKTSLKTKVEAFEKLGEKSYTPTRLANKRKDDRVNGYTDTMPTKSKVPTPSVPKFNPKACSTSRAHRKLMGKQDDSPLNGKSAMTLKASREVNNTIIKKDDALKKREAFLQSLTETNRKKREEKQIKAQQQREQLEKEKQKHNEMQKIKEEKSKKLLAEKEEKLRKQKLESERKRLLAKKKAEANKEQDNLREEEQSTVELKNMTELVREAEKKKMHREQQKLLKDSLPIYMTTKAPLLNTEDCYDSDDPERGRYQYVNKDWERGETLVRMQKVIIAAGESIKNSFFCRQTHTPDLIEIFEKIDANKLKRTSSAVWRKPPRYTLFAVTKNTKMFSDSEDD